MEPLLDKGAEVIPFPARAPAASDTLCDLRFRALVGETGWAALPETTRARFGKRVAKCRTAIYAGEIVECRMNLAGLLLAQLCRLIGGPLPLTRDADQPALVSITEDAASGGQYWTRIYGRRRGFPQVIHSSKRFAGPTGLEEYVGRGVGIALRVEVADGALHFLSDHYFLQLGRMRLRLPRWLAPGRMRVSHIDCKHGLFAFVLKLDHPLFGTLIHQTAMFRDMKEDEQ
ncbi:DUF4166 domain-containing protein [Allosphingosinicella sp.]|uniref:DUF4166 domain-containing protein n=1 Tax=Allosphingosinicella sp. TaxID=2823234 RepID=UPI0037843B76